jgi:hypothetical protein
MTLLKIYAAMALVSWPLISGMVYSDMMYRYYTVTTARREIGNAIALGGLASVVWPLALPGVFLISGFAEHGIWNSHHTDHIP